MTIPRSIVVAIANAVEAHGGDMTDVEDLVQTWERLHADNHGRVDRLRYDAGHPACHCADADDTGERCERCHGFMGQRG